MPMQVTSNSGDPMNVAIYIRVSTQEQKQHGISVDAQESACRQWVQDNHHALVGVYNDAGLSARAKLACRNSGYDPADHFADAGKMIDIGSGAKRH